MGCWGAGIMESDTALDAECMFYDIAGMDSDEEGSPVDGGRARMEAVLTELAAAAAMPAFVGDLPQVLKLFESMLTYPTAMSAPFKARLEAAAQLIRSGRAVAEDERLTSVVPSYDRACSHQVLATLLMRHGCAFTEELRQQMLDQLLNCDEHAMALDGTTGRFFEHDERHRARYRERTAALNELWQQLSRYDIRGGQPCELKSRGLFEVLQSAPLESAHVH